MSGERGVRLLGAGDVRALASRLGVRPTKKLGQNFVVEPATVRQIAALAGPFAPGDVILEVGPGLGSLTLALLEAASGVPGARLVAVEIDPVLAAELPKTIADRAPALADRAHVMQADALTLTPQLLGLPQEEHEQGVYLREGQTGVEGGSDLREGTGFRGDLREGLGPARASGSGASEPASAGRAAEGSEERATLPAQPDENRRGPGTGFRGVEGGTELREGFRPARVSGSGASEPASAGRAAEGSEERATLPASPAGGIRRAAPGPGDFAGPGRRSRMGTAGVPEPGSGGSKGGGAPLGSTAPQERIILAANLPYNVAVPVVLHLLAAFGSVRRGVVMVQAEVADRMCAGPGSRVYGVPSAKLAWYARARPAGTVPRTVFWPVPNVDSKLVAFERHGQPVAGASRAEVFAVIDAAFGQRRKTLRAALSGWAGSPAGAERVLRAAGVDPGARGESLDMTEFAAIAAAAARYGMGQPAGDG